MPNKLKDIFTKEPLERKTRFEFFDEKGYADFIEGLKKVGEEGCPVEVKGVKAVHNTVGNGIKTTSPNNVEKDMSKLMDWYNSLKKVTEKELLN